MELGFVCVVNCSVKFTIIISPLTSAGNSEIPYLMKISKDTYLGFTIVVHDNFYIYGSNSEIARNKDLEIMLHNYSSWLSVKKLSPNVKVIPRSYA